MFAVATGKVKVDSFFGLGRSKERVLYCEPINAGGSVLALPTLRDGNNVLAVIPNIGHTALEIGPDSDGLTFSLIRYKGLVDAPIAAGERVVHKLIRSMATIS